MRVIVRNKSDLITIGLDEYLVRICNDFKKIIKIIQNELRTEKKQ